MEWRRLSWLEEKLSLVKVELQVVCTHSVKNVNRTRRDLYRHLGYRPDKRQNWLSVNCIAVAVKAV